MTTDSGRGLFEAALGLYMLGRTLNHGDMSIQELSRNFIGSLIDKEPTDDEGQSKPLDLSVNKQPSASSGKHETKLKFSFKLDTSDSNETNQITIKSKRKQTSPNKVLLSTTKSTAIKNNKNVQVSVDHSRAPSVRKRGRKKGFPKQARKNSKLMNPYMIYQKVNRPLMWQVATNKTARAMSSLLSNQWFKSSEGFRRAYQELYQRMLATSEEKGERAACQLMLGELGRMPTLDPVTLGREQGGTLAVANLTTHKQMEEFVRKHQRNDLTNLPRNAQKTYFRVKILALFGESLFPSEQRQNEFAAQIESDPQMEGYFDTAESAARSIKIAIREYRGRLKALAQEGLLNITFRKRNE